MARASTTSDAFNAVAEQVRRDILEALAHQALAVNDLVELLGLTQPQISKHLGVLRAVDLVRVRADGRQRIYSINASVVRDLYDWIKPFERLWNDRFDRLDHVLTTLEEPPQATKRKDKS